MFSDHILGPLEYPEEDSPPAQNYENAIKEFKQNQINEISQTSKFESQVLSYGMYKYISSKVIEGIVNEIEKVTQEKRLIISFLKEKNFKLNCNS